MSDRYLIIRIVLAGLVPLLIALYLASMAGCIPFAVKQKCWAGAKWDHAGKVADEFKCGVETEFELLKVGK